VQQFSDNVTSLLGQWPVPQEPYNFDQQTVYVCAHSVKAFVHCQTVVRELTRVLAGVIRFLFTGMQNINWIPPQPRPSTAFDIIQPVLQVQSVARVTSCDCLHDADTRRRHRRCCVVGTVRTERCRRVGLLGHRLVVRHAHR
jgi:hypothetical protein